MAKSAMNKPVFNAVIVSIGGFVFGFDAAVISGVLSEVTVLFALDTWQQGWVVSAPTLGGIIAALTMGPLADLIGRKKVLLLLGALYTVSAGFSAFAPNVETLIIARFVGGLAFGSLMIAPVYIGETTSANTRGAMVSINQLNIVVGLSVAYFSNFLLLQVSQWDSAWVTSLSMNEQIWRWMLGVELIPALIWLLLLPRIPESPRWLLIDGQTERAEGILVRLFDNDEIEHIRAEVYAEHTHPPLLERLQILLSPRLRFAIGVGLIVGIAQQITGVNAIYFYAPTIFEQTGVGTDAAFVQAVYVGITNVVFTVAAIALIDRLGRRPLMIGGLAGVVISLSVAAIGFSNETVNSNLVLLGILGFVASFAISLGPVMWVLFSEIFPNAIRGVAIALVGVVNSATSFFVQLVFPTLLDRLGGSLTLAFYATMGVVFLLLVIRYLPETKGQSLEELELTMGTRQ